MKPSRRAKHKEVQREVRVMLFAFGLFTEVMDMNPSMPKEYITLYTGLRNIVNRHYWRNKNHLDFINATMARHTREHDIDLALASISAVAFYYEHLKGQRTFSPMSHKEVRDLQCSMLDENYDHEKASLDFAEAVVLDLLNS